MAISIFVKQSDKAICLNANVVANVLVSSNLCSRIEEDGGWPFLARTLPLWLLNYLFLNRDCRARILAFDKNKGCVWSFGYINYFKYYFTCIINMFLIFFFYIFNYSFTLYTSNSKKLLKLFQGIISETSPEVFDNFTGLSWSL